MIMNSTIFTDIRALKRKACHLLGFIPAVSLILGFGSCNGKETGHDEHGNETHADDHNDKGLILLSEEQISKFGIESESIEPGEFSNITKVSGEISAMPGSEGAVAARQAGIVRLASGISVGVSVSAGRTVATITARGMSGGDPNEAARVAYQAAKRELDRLTPLHKEGIVSTRDYNAALQRVEETKVAMGGSTAGSGSAATAPVSGVITSIDVVDGQFVDAGQTIAAISSNNALTLRADLPESSVSRLAGITGARFRPTYSEEFIDVIASGGKMISKPSATSASGGYIPIYFTLPKGESDIINGTYCEVYLLGSTRSGVLTVAEESVNEQQGKFFVYVEKEPGHYEKRPVVIGPTDGQRREILSGLRQGEKVVSKGMTFVKLAETSGAVPEGHSHSH